MVFMSTHRHSAREREREKENRHSALKWIESGGKYTKRGENVELQLLYGCLFAASAHRHAKEFSEGASGSAQHILRQKEEKDAKHTVRPGE